MKCKICGNQENNTLYEPIEMMFGYKDKFKYVQCSQCNCLQIVDVPEDIEKYYPDNYYSLNSMKRNNILKDFIKTKRDKFALTGKGLIGKVIYKKYPNYELSSVSQVDINKNLRILDVGCGSGNLLMALHSCGFNNLSGVDLYIKNSIDYGNGVKIIKGTIFDVQDKFDLIMFHHSFEHMENPLDILKCVHKLLSDKGLCIIRIPTVSSFAWNQYGVNWVQLDAPRHFFLHSIESINFLAKHANLQVKDIIYDSTDFQFWGSEQYINGIPLFSEKSYLMNKSNSIFDTSKIKYFKDKAEELNINKMGDQSIFYLHKCDLG